MIGTSFAKPSATVASINVGIAWPARHFRKMRFEGCGCAHQRVFTLLWSFETAYVKIRILGRHLSDGDSGWLVAILIDGPGK
jgi:hypothetical protein